MHAEFQFRLDTVGAVAISLVHHEQIRDLVEPRLHHLYPVAAFGHRDDYRCIGEVHHTQFGLPDADRLDNYDVVAESVQQFDDFARRAAETAVMATGRQAPNIDAGVLVMVCHADAIAQHRSARKRARRIDRQHRDQFTQRAIFRDKTVDQRRLAGAGRPGYSDDISVADAPVDALHHDADLGRAILDQRDQSRERDAVSLCKTL